MTTPAIYTAPISVEIESPFLFRGLAARQHGLDAAHIRDHDGRPVIPGPEIKGVLRHALKMLDAPDKVKAWFGERDMPERRGERVVFRDCVMQAPEKAARTTRIRIDGDTGTVKKGHLQVVELVLPVGAQAVFRGAVSYVARDPADAELLRDWLDRALKIVRSMGAFKTAGFGRVLRDGTKVSPADAGVALVPATVARKRDYELSFALDRPLLVDADQTAPNVFRGRPVIPGAVLKGALAERLRAAGVLEKDGPLDRALSRLTIGHAFPSLDGTAAAPVWPKSLAVLTGDLDGVDARPFYDAAVPEDWTDAMALVGANRWLAFQPDWKGGTDGPPMITRTRVKIDEKTGAAEEGNLFSQVMVAHRVKGTPMRWTARIAWPDDAPDGDAELGRLTAVLNGGLHGIGKTRAMMETVEVSAVPKEAPLPASGQVRVMLRTPHLMIRAAALKDGAALENAVRDYWQAASGGALQLGSAADGPGFFATQTLIGGQQLVRFAYDPKVVEPFVCMDAGSVFVLEMVKPERARRLLDSWRRHGLPTGTKVSWDKCPFVPENGFGAIEIDPPLPEAGP